MIKTNYELLSPTVQANILALTINDIKYLFNMGLLDCFDASKLRSPEDLPERFKYYSDNFISGIIFSYNKPKDKILSMLAENKILILYNFSIEKFNYLNIVDEELIARNWFAIKDALSNYREKESKLDNNKKLPSSDKSIDLYKDSNLFLDVTDLSEYKLLQIQADSLFHHDDIKEKVLISINKKFTDEERIDLLFNHATCIYNNKIIIGDGRTTLSLLEFALNNYGSDKLYKYFDKSEAVKNLEDELLIPHDILSNDKITMLNTIVSKKHFSEYNVITDLNNIGLKSYNCVDKIKLEEWERNVYANIDIAEKQLFEYMKIVRSNVSTFIEELKEKTTGKHKYDDDCAKYMEVFK